MSETQSETKTITKKVIIDSFSPTDLIFYSLIPGGQNLARMKYYNSTTEQSFWMLPFFNLPVVQFIPLLIMSNTMKVVPSTKTNKNIINYLVLLIPIGVKIFLFKSKDKKLDETKQFLIMIAASIATMFIYNLLSCGTINLNILTKSFKSGVFFSIFPEIATHLSQRSKIINMLGNFTKKYSKSGKIKKDWKEPGLWIFYYSYLASTLALVDANENNCKDQEFNLSSMLMVSIIAFLAYKVKMNTNPTCSLF